jgi:hypothetical protein
MGQTGVFFVIRHKENNKFKSIKENPLPKSRHQHLLKDEIIELIGPLSISK